MAISGAGNLDFSPVIAGSGYDGATGSYELTIRATDLGLSGDGPTVLSSDPAAGAVLDSSPLAIRLEMSGPLDPNTILPGQTVQLFSEPDGTLGDGAGHSGRAGLGQFFRRGQRAPALPPGAAGARQLCGTARRRFEHGPAVLADPNGVPLGEDAAHPAGADESFSFQVDGIDGVAGATGSDDTAATARDLGNVAGAGLIQVNGAIGDDPSFNPSLSPDPTNPSRNSSPPTRWTSITSRSPGRDDTRCSPKCSPAGSARPWTPASACSSSIRATVSSSFSPAITTRSTPPRAPTGRSPCSPTRP